MSARASAGPSALARPGNCGAARAGPSASASADPSTLARPGSTFPSRVTCLPGPVLSLLPWPDRELWCSQGGPSASASADPFTLARPGSSFPSRVTCLQGPVQALLPQPVPALLPRPGLRCLPWSGLALLPQPVLAGVVGGVCFLGVAVLVSILAACLMNRRRAARRRRKRLRQGRSLGAPPSLSTSYLEKLQPPARARCVPPASLLFHFPQADGAGVWRGVRSAPWALVGLGFSYGTSCPLTLTDPPLIFSPAGKSAPQ